MKKQQLKIIAAALIATLCIACENSEEPTLVGNGTTPRAVGPWQRVFTDNFDNTTSFTRWQRTGRFDYNSNLCQYDPAVPLIATYDNKSVLVLTATKNGNIWKSGHVKSNFNFKPGINEEYHLVASIKLIAMNGGTYTGFSSTYGVWPTIWTVQETGWPTKGEIDIFEGYSY